MFLILWLCLIISVHISQTNTQSGPDPWDLVNNPSEISDEAKLPPGIQIVPKRKTEKDTGIGEWFFKRMLVIFLKGGQTQQNEDGSVDISLQMKFEPNEWEVVQACLNPESPLSEHTLRMVLGYVQESIYKPSFVEKVTMAWSDYVQVYLTEYMPYITWTLGILGTIGGLFWLWTYLSLKQALSISALIYYAYQVYISYKEEEQKELDKFIAAVNRCNWYFWSSSHCDVPIPNPVAFLKIFNPIPIAMNLATVMFTEPLVALNDTIDIYLAKLTGDLWYPFNKMTYGILSIFIYITLILFFVGLFYNWVLNIPCKFKVLFGFFGIELPQRNRTFFSNSTDQEPSNLQEPGSLSEATFNRFLDFCNLALTNTQNNRDNAPMLQPNGDNVPMLQPNENIAPMLQPNGNNAPILQPHRDNVHIIQPNRDNGPMLQPNGNNAPILQPHKDNVHIIQPNRDNGPMLQPNGNNAPILQPHKDNVPVIQPNRDNAPMLQANGDNAPMLQANGNNVPVLQQNRNNAPMLNPIRDNTLTLQPKRSGIRRSASAGRLLNGNWSSDNNFDNMATLKNMPYNGGGDAR